VVTRTRYIVNIMHELLMLFKVYSKMEKYKFFCQISVFSTKYCVLCCMLTSCICYLIRYLTKAVQRLCRNYEQFKSLC
jgi:hypothetical protein